MLLFTRSTVTPPPPHKDNGRFVPFFRQSKLTNRFRKEVSPAFCRVTLDEMWQKAASKLFDRAARLKTEHNVGGVPRQCQAGRTLLEMLSILAIISILSVTAVTGILYAFNKHKANVIIQDVSLTAAVVITNDAFLSVQDEQQIFNPELPSPLSGFPVTPFRVNADVFVITVQNVPQSVCKHVMMGPNPSDFLIEVNGAVAKENPKTLCTNNTNTMNFYFDASQNAERCGGQICTNGHVCVDDECVCPDDRVDQNGVCVCRNGMEECNDQCYNPCDFSLPGILGTRDPDTCQCLCDQTGGFKPFAQNGTCVCDNGFLLNNACVSLACEPAGCTDGNCTCFITTAGGEKQRCGTGCSPTGASCQVGYCTDINQCTGQSIEHLSVADYYGCIHRTIECYYVRGQEIRCYNTVLSPSACGRGCHTDGTDCDYGDCTDDCTSDGLTYTLTQNKATPLYSYDTYYGCFHEREDGTEMMCEVNAGRYMCYKDGKYCGTKCQKDGTDCSSHSSCEDCPAGTEPFETQTTSACARPDGVYCIVMNNVPDQYTCYMPNQTLCAERCYDFADNCQNGTCDSSDCPSGTRFQLQDGTSQFYGCYNPDTDLFCRMVYYPNSGIHCWKNGLLCGTQCSDYNGNGDRCTDCQTQLTCPDGMTETTYIYASDNKEYNACRKENLVCLNNAAQTCYLSDKRCGEQCDPDGQNCRTGACTAQDANCPNGFIYALNPYFSGNIYGCTSYSQNLSCVYIDGAYRCYKNGFVCGNGCSPDGTGCLTGVCSAADCPDGQEPVYDTSDAFKCATVDKTVSCSGTTGAYTCSINNNVCGYNCADEQGSSCEQGICRADECPTGFTLDYVTSGTYGCTNPDTFTQCFRTGSTYTCWKNGALCGENCSVSGTGGSCDTGCV